MKLLKSFFFLLVSVVLMSSCSAPTYLAAPNINYPYIKNTCNLGIQNMDEEAKVEEQNLTCHYENFDIRYKLIENYKDYIITFEIVNKSNKSMIIDKSKCYVLRNGYATELFKDVRSTRSTTFNNVQDAINNVQTNESGVSMSIPPYSTFAIAINETNIEPLKKLPQFISEEGNKALTPYDDIDITEFILPYSFDYSLAKWNTSRNRVYFNNIMSEKVTIPGHYKNKYPRDGNRHINDKNTLYVCYRADWSTPIDYTEANRIDDLNIEMYKKHRRDVIITHVCLSPITIPAVIATNIILLPIAVFMPSDSGTPFDMFLLYGCHDHYPAIYGNKYVQRESGKVKIRDDYKE